MQRFSPFLMMGKRVSLFGAIWLHTRAPRIRYARSLFAARLLQQHGLGFGARRKLHFEFADTSGMFWAGMMFRACALNMCILGSKTYC